MSTRRKKKKSQVKLVLFLLVLLLIVGAITVLKIASVSRNKDAKQAEEAAEASEAQAEEEAEEAEQAKADKIAEEKSQWYLILVNPWNEIPEDYDIETADIEDGYVADVRIQDALREMLADCREAGYSPMIVSTFRTRETQQYLYDHTANKADTAVPGHSEHECGLAADIIDSGSAGWSDPLIDEQEDMPTQIWLMEHCQDYGFILRYPKDKEEITGIIYEPWHYRYVGKEHAANIMSNGLCLEEYIENMETYYDPD